MRNMVVRLSRVLLTLAGIGILIMVVGFLYFTGVASSVDIHSEPLTWGRVFFGFDYRVLTAFGFFLLLMGLFPVLAVLDANAKRGVKKLYVHLVFLVGFGFIMLIYSTLVYGEYLTPFDQYHTWFDYFIIAALLIIVGLSTILFSVQNRERLWNFKLFFAFFILVGLLLQITSVLVYNQILDLPGYGWDMFFLVGLIILFLGFVPLLLTASSNFRNILHQLRIIWILGAFVGFILFLLSYLVYAEIISQSTVLDVDWFVFLAYGSLLILLTLLPWASAERSHGSIKRLRFIWLLLFLVGAFLVIISAILVLPTSYEVERAIGTLDLNFGAPWDIFYIYGTIITMVSLIFICSILYFETEKLGVTEGLVESIDRLPGVEASSSEMIAYLEILSRSYEDMVNQFKEAVRSDKFRPRVYEAILKQTQDRNRSVKSRIESFQKGEPTISAPEDVESLFDVAMGKPSEVLPPSEPPTEAPRAAPPPPSAPPVPPTQAPPPVVPSAAPLTPSLSPITPPPAPGVLPSQPSESPLDLIADARSTSIAELRGEMLKELRRLREIFKEE